MKISEQKLVWILISLVFSWIVTAPTQEVSTSYDISPETKFIKVDQFGYLPTEGTLKTAVITDPQVGYNALDSFTPGST